MTPPPGPVSVIGPGGPYHDRRLRQEEHVDVRIGVKNSPREIEVSLAQDTDTDAVREHIDASVADGGMLWFTDRRGRQYGVPVDKIAWVEIDASPVSRRIGFGG